MNLTTEVIRYIIAAASVPVIVIILYFFFKASIWKTSQEIHFSKFDLLVLRAKYIIMGIIMGAVPTSIAAYLGWI